ncbi:MAG: hypothetical protein ACLQFR_04480 [Streptosporangiaceae bacterium]
MLASVCQARKPGAMIAARFGQGTGAALLTPAALSIITTTYTGGRAGRRHADNMARLAGGVPGQRASRRGRGPGQPAPPAAHARPAPGCRDLDLPGAALAVAGLVTLAYALARAPAYGWTSVRTAWLLPSRSPRMAAGLLRAPQPLARRYWAIRGAAALSYKPMGHRLPPRRNNRRT